MRCHIYIFLFYLFPVQQTTSGIDHRVKNVPFFGLATNTLNVRNNDAFRFFFKQYHQVY